MIRYADDVAVLCHSQEQARQVKARLATWLAPRGLSFNEDKTKVVHLTEGFDFLGVNVRRYPGGKLLIKPSKAAIRRLRGIGPAAETRALRGANAMAVIARLSPITRGWAAYYRTVVSAEVFSALDHYVFKLTYKWAKYRHPNKPKRWVVGRYFGAFNKFRNDRWVFGDRDSGGHLVKFAWTSINRHVMVKGAASTDDPALADYWASRRRRSKPPLDSYTLGLLTRQDGHCPLCGDHLPTADQPPQSPQEWERWWLQVTRKAIAASYLVHHTGDPAPPVTARPASCTHPAIAGSRPRAPEPGTADLHALAACLSCLRRKPTASPEGTGRSNALRLPDRQTCVDVLCAYLRMPYEPDPGQDAPTPQRLAFQAIREVRHTVIRVITAHLKNDAAVSWQGLNFDFTGAVFDGGNFVGAGFSGGDFSRFIDAQFSSGTVYFSIAQFSGGVVFFNGAQFSGGEVASTMPVLRRRRRLGALSSPAARSTSGSPSSPAARSASGAPCSPAARSTSGAPSSPAGEASFGSARSPAAGRVRAPSSPAAGLVRERRFG